MNKLWGVWELGDKIGQGSFGEVYKSHKTELGKTFYSAIKHISLPKSQDEIEDIVREGYATTSKDILEYYKDTIDDLVKEIEIMYELRANKNIVDYQDHLIIEKTNGETGFDIYIRMELLKSIDDLFLNEDLKDKDVLKLGIDIANALEELESEKFIHRDIKPENIFINSKGVYKLGDFGEARELNKTISNVLPAHEEVNPKTGDYGIDLSIMIFIFSSIGLLLVLLIWKKENIENNG